MIKKYFIIPTSQVTNRIINLSIHNDISTCRKCNCGAHVIVEAQTPVDSSFLDYQGMTKEVAEMIHETNPSEWGEPPQQLLAKLTSKAKGFGRKLIG